MMNLVRSIAIPGTVNWYIKRLDHKKLRVMRNAAIKLGKIGDSRALGPLIEKLSGNVPERKAAKEALIKLGATKEQMVEGYIKALKGFSYSTAVWELGELGDKLAVEPLIKALENWNGRDREEAVKALGKLGDKRAVEPLTERLEDEDWKVRKTAVEVLEKLGATKEQMVLGYMKALASPHIGARKEAAEALGKFGDKQAVEPLIERLEDEDWEVRKAAIEVLVQFNATSKDMIINYHIAALHANRKFDTDAYYAIKVRSSSAKKLGDLGDTKAVEPLIERLEKDYIQDDYNSDLENVVEALGKLGDKRAFESLIKVINSVIGKENLVLKRIAISALGKLGDKRAFESLIDIFEDDRRDRVERGAAAHALGDLRDPRAIEPLIKRAWRDDVNYYGNPTERAAAAEALDKLSTEYKVLLIDGLINALSSDEPYFAIKELGELGNTRALQALKHVRDNSPDPMLVKEIEASIQKILKSG